MSIMRYTAFAYVALDLSESSVVSPSPKSLMLLGRILQSRHTAIIAVSTALTTPVCIAIVSTWCQRIPALNGLRVSRDGLACELSGLFEIFSAMITDLAPAETTPPAAVSGRTMSAPNPAVVALAPKPVKLPSPSPASTALAPKTIAFKPLNVPPPPVAMVAPVVMVPQPAQSPQGPRLNFGCSCVHLGSPPCTGVLVLLRQFPTICRLAADSSKPYQCIDCSASDDAMWGILADVVLTHGLFEVNNRLQLAL